MSETVVGSTAVPGAETHNPYFDEFSELINKPYQSPEQREAEAAEKQAAQEREAQELRARYKAEFDSTPAGRRLQQERDDVYIKGAFKKLTDAMQNNEPWYYELMAEITHAVFSEDPRYQALQQYYDKLFNEYVLAKYGRTI